MICDSQLFVTNLSPVISGVAWLININASLTQGHDTVPLSLTVGHRDMIKGI